MNAYKSARAAECAALLMVVASAAAPLWAQSATPTSKHVVLVVEENHGYDEALSKMPKLKALAEDYAIATQYYANCHPSIGNYFTITTGQKISTNDSFDKTVSQENIVSQMVAQKKPWKVYADGLPAVGYLDHDNGKTKYVKRHVPMTYFDVVRNSEEQRANIVPFDRFNKDLQSPSGLPEFSLIIPNTTHDAHGSPPFHPGSLTEADTWLQENVIRPLLDTREFQKDGDGVLIITFDEARDADKTHGGGHILTVVAGPRAKSKYKDDKFHDNFYQHESLFVTLESTLGLPRLKIVENTRDLGDLFQ